MRWRSFHATLTAVALFAGATTLAQAQDIDLFGDAPSAAPARPAKAAATPAPAGTPKPGLSVTAPGAKPTQAATVQSPAPTLRGDDPEPDGIVKPAVPAPAKDPLDAPKLVVAKPDSAKPDSAKPDAAASGSAPSGSAKLDPAKPDLSKADLSKPDAAAPGASKIAVAPPPLAPLNAAIKAALAKSDATEIHGALAGERRKERAAVAAYYEARGFAPTWSADGKPVAAVEPVLNRLARAGDDALAVPAVPGKLVATGTADEVASSDVALTDAVVAYARQASGARIDPRAISPLIGARPALANPAEVLDEVAAAGPAAGDKLAALNPIDPRYAALRDRFVALRGAHAASGAPIPTGPTLKIGMHDPRVLRLRARLGLMASDLVADEDEYDMSIAEAVAAYQRGAGLRVTGKLDQATTAALSGAGKTSPLEAALAANMEMWRWMPRDLGRDRIEVDVPAYTVTVFHDGEPVASNRVVVGKTETPTPLFSNVMKYLIVNPVWNVPQSIIKKEMLPKMGRSGELRGFDVSYRNGQMVVKQPSGEKNALGRIKFIFPNDFSVYLHDTPSKSLFSATKRAFSHGCVRVDQPFDFAYSVLNDSVPEGGKVLWSEKRLDKLIGDEERYVNLPKPLPIHIEYFTASVDPESGRVVQREDIYGYAHAVAAALSGESRPAIVAERKPRRLAEHAAAKTAVATDEDPR